MAPHLSSSIGIPRPSLAFLVWVGVTAALVIGMPGRAMAQAVIVVNSSSDQNTTDGDNQCTLREAITVANTDGNPVSQDCPGSGDFGADTIRFDLSPQDLTITLASALPPITDAQLLTINGLTLQQGNEVAISGNNTVRVFLVDAGASLTVESLTVKEGNAGEGGGILNHGTLVVAHSTLTGNHASRDGGGISNFSTLAVATLTVTHSTLAGNTCCAGGTIGGGGIINGGTLTVTHSTLVGNVMLSAESHDKGGGGILNYVGTALITNSTLANNSSPTVGGGIHTFTGTTTIAHSTLVGNSAGSSAGGGGIFDQSATNITDSIVANNSGGDCGSAFVAQANNLDTDGSCPGFATKSEGELNLGPLADNGGPTQTFALLPGSVAINAGDPSRCGPNGITTDQRGLPRDTACDIGAFEFGAEIPALLDEVSSLLASGTPSAAGLLAKLNAALASVGSGNTGAACNKLEALINQVNGNSTLTAAERQALLDAAHALRAALGC